MQELSVKDTDNFIVENGMGHFPAYAKLKKEALDLSQNLKNIVVTEDTIKTNKKLVAATRKATDLLNKRLIEFKKDLLIPYEQVKGQVDEIVSIVKEAEDTVRSQTREFEELERYDKNNNINIIFNKRLKHYKMLVKYEISYSRLFESRYLNKTMSINKVEDDLVEKMERIEQDLNLIDKHDDRNTLFIHYLNNLNITEAFSKLEKEKEIVKAIKEDNNSNTKTYKIEVFTEAHYQLLKMYCEKINIKFK
ncbi:MULTISPECIES: DUF1351 domain-containing protein [unclassified Gemella]|uniref:DUF1351 domain-containing protein n=1 Tax=unclassified Gemella TaxID=2624949 RepID=UPI001073779E|nr:MULTISPECIES: DUF1351 domain-containing protein [unclassified Gemella]MBF0709747.1 DUF1351 domain-containing protein [Gemella sp. GL1.1]MBF0747264.1 DUF1351 domain-containing protein [Gemella sp. 19428wG2_WT2a]NYS27091.1 DUF1351 domain-containing protein [Gemella sp. GL1]TFU57849.1 DUF1351 domain-containing protein [Gemella sp. WT2a]